MDINGYRTLSAEEIATMNQIKALGEQVGHLVDRLRTHPEFDQRWVSEGRTDLQKGFMSLNRAVAQPTTFA